MKEEQTPNISLEGTTNNRKRYVRSLEYELIANLALQQYTREGEPQFEQLLSLPLKERIPALVMEYGLKRMHRMVKMILQEYVYNIPLPKYKKLNDTRISVCAIELIIASAEDQLSIEDLIVFLEASRRGRYGKIRGSLTHAGIMLHLEQYRQERYDRYVLLKAEREKALKGEGPTERTSPQPTAIKHLFSELEDDVVPLKKIS